ncbi:ATP-dependent RNA helicase DDX55 [Liparis tanakae]|uniref:ATP-dependent RNA helicase n=1 Tax=Liparis tanakae TaxID=230148 RepID=A0A4Z2E644_9TELE|nr:ATP-dependent RNA helicase DDX55 [Liparis tanakae]
MIFHWTLEALTFLLLQVGALIITPTRELALQISEVMALFLQKFPQFTPHGVRVRTESRRALEPTSRVNAQTTGSDIISGAPGPASCPPGRQELTCCSLVCLRQILLIGGSNPMDDVDKFKDKGLNTILGHLPKQRRTGLFSATQTQELEKLVRAGLRNPVRISVKEKGVAESAVAQKTPSRLCNYYTICRTENKFNQLVAFLRQHKLEKHLIFFSTCACVEYYGRALETLVKRVTVHCIHGKMRSKRNQIFADFRALKKSVWDNHN